MGAFCSKSKSKSKEKEKGSFDIDKRLIGCADKEREVVLKNFSGTPCWVLRLRPIEIRRLHQFHHVRSSHVRIKSHKNDRLVLSGRFDDGIFFVLRITVTDYCQHFAYAKLYLGKRSFNLEFFQSYVIVIDTDPDPVKKTF